MRGIDGLLASEWVCFPGQWWCPDPHPGPLPEGEGGGKGSQIHGFWIIQNGSHSIAEEIRRLFATPAFIPTPDVLNWG